MSRDHISVALAANIKNQLYQKVPAPALKLVKAERMSHLEGGKGATGNVLFLPLAMQPWFSYIIQDG